MSKYCEPWTHDVGVGVRVHSDAGIVEMMALDPPDIVALAERAVVCVNACATIPHPEKLPELMNAVKEFNDANEEYDRVSSTANAHFRDHARCVARIAVAQVRLRETYRAVMGETT